MPQADLLVSDRARLYLNKEGKAYFQALMTKKDIDRQKKAFVDASEGITLNSQAAAKQWVGNVLDTFAAHVTDIPPVLPLSMAGERQYSNDVLYIISTPEFALNGYLEGSKKWTAAGAFPQSLETYIQTEAQQQLNARFKHLHVLLVFSCFTHTYDTRNIVAIRGQPEEPRFIGTNRLSIVSTDSPSARTVTKFRWDTTDSAKGLFMPDKEWDTNGNPTFNAPGTLKNQRSTEIQVGLPWKETDGHSVILGFGTCQDVAWDNHPIERVVILCGSGTPFMRTPEAAVPDLPMTYPFTVNDAKSWWTEPAPPDQDVLTSHLWAAGFYQFDPVGLPHGAVSVRATFVNAQKGGSTRLQAPGFRLSNKSMDVCYLYPSTIQHDQGARTFADALAHGDTGNPILTKSEGPEVSLYQSTPVLPLPPPRG